MKRVSVIALFFLFSISTIFGIASRQTSAAFNKDMLIDDIVFSNSGSMSAGAIDAFLNARGSCISANSGFSAPDPIGYSPSGGFQYGGNVTAGNVIAHSAQVYGLNPQVLLVTLQKEQSLVTSTSCSTNTISKAMGYGCPDSGGSYSYSGLNLYTRSGTTFTSVNGICVNSAAKAGFSQQTIRAAWLLKFSQERSLGHTNWAVIQGNWDNSDDLSACYSGYMTQGTLKRCPNGSATFFDGWATIDGVATHMNSGATASLYRYTPHFHGNQNFVSLFESWFGPTTGIASVITMTNISQPSNSPARGQTISYTASFTNNHSAAVTLDAVGIVGRLGDIHTGANRDLGWQGPVTIQAGATQQFTFSDVVRDSGTIYVWPAINYQGTYVHYNNWGATLVTRAPNFTLSQPLATSPTTVYAGQNVTFSALLKNNEPYPINYDAIGIPVKFYNHYNYDAVWVGPGVIGPGAEITLNGMRNIDKPGPFTYWVSNYFSGTYSTIGPVKNFSSLVVAPSFSVSGLSFNSTTPALGQNLEASFTVTNNLPVPIDIDGVGVVGRLGTFNGPNRDIHWQGPVHFNAGETKSFSAGFTRTITDVGAHHYWIGVFDSGNYLQYNNWGATIVSRAPSFSVSGLSFNSTTPALGQNLEASFTVTNNLPVPIDIDGVGVVGRLGTFNGPNRDIHWQGPVHFNAGETKSFSAGFTRTITDVGAHHYWIGVFDSGNYLQYNNWGATIVSHN